MATFQPSHYNPTESKLKIPSFADIQRKVVRAKAAKHRRDTIGKAHKEKQKDFDFEYWKAHNAAMAAKGLTPSGLPVSEAAAGGKMTRPTDDPLDLMVVDIEEESGRGLMGYLPWVLGGVAALGLGIYFIRRR